MTPAAKLSEKEIAINLAWSIVTQVSQPEIFLFCIRPSEDDSVQGKLQSGYSCSQMRGERPAGAGASWPRRDGRGFSYSPGRWDEGCLPRGQRDLNPTE